MCEYRDWGIVIAPWESTEEYVKRIEEMGFKKKDDTEDENDE